MAMLLWQNYTQETMLVQGTQGPQIKMTTIQHQYIKKSPLKIKMIKNVENM